MKIVRLYGFLGEDFGTHHELEIASPGEAVRALCATMPGFEETMIAEQKYGFQVFVDELLVDASKLETLVSDREVVKIVPVLMAAKDGFGRILTGIALIALAYVTMGGSTMGDVLFSYIGAQGATYAGAIGFSMVLGGISQILATTPGAKDGSIGGSDTPNYAFSGPVNTTAQGAPIPILYGRLRVGSVVVSAGIDSNSFYLDNGATTQDGTRYGNGTATPWVWAKAPVITA